MSRIFEASCLAGVVTVGGLPVPSATIISQGTKASTGYLVLDGAKAVYIASNATDIADLITALNSMITNISLVLASLDTTLNSGANAATITAINLANTQLNLMKELLK